MKSRMQCKRKVGVRVTGMASVYVWVYSHSKDIRTMIEREQAVAVREVDGATLYRVPARGRGYYHMQAICRRVGLGEVMPGNDGSVFELRQQALETDHCPPKHIPALVKPISAMSKALPSSQSILGTKEATRFFAQRNQLAFKVFGFDLTRCSVGKDRPGLTREQQIALLDAFIGRNLVATRNTPAYAQWAERERRLIALSEDGMDTSGPFEPQQTFAGADKEPQWHGPKSVKDLRYQEPTEVDLRLPAMSSLEKDMRDKYGIKMD